MATNYGVGGSNPSLPDCSCRCGGIGRRARFRFSCLFVGVQVSPSVFFPGGQDRRKNLTVAILFTIIIKNHMIELSEKNVREILLRRFPSLPTHDVDGTPIDTDLYCLESLYSDDVPRESPIRFVVAPSEKAATPSCSKELWPKASAPKMACLSAKNHVMTTAQLPPIPVQNGSSDVVALVVAGVGVTVAATLLYWIKVWSDK